MACFALASYIGSLLRTIILPLSIVTLRFDLGITRITDNRHHPTDVLAGAILGTVIAIIAVEVFR